MNVIKPLISIITINYNNLTGLRKTMESVFSQSFQDFNYIIIDGGSSDGSRNLIESYLETPDFKKHVSYWCSESDMGIYNAMNKGIKHADGEWIYMLNSGDALIKNVLEPVSKMLKSHENQIVYGAIDCYINSRYVCTSCDSSDNLNNGMIPHQGTFYPKSFHDKYGLYNEDYRILADWDFTLRLKEKGCTFYHIPLIIAEYDLSGISTTNNTVYEKECKKIQLIHGIKMNKGTGTKAFLKLFIPPVIIKVIKKLAKR